MRPDGPPYPIPPQPESPGSGRIPAAHPLPPSSVTHHGRRVAPFEIDPFEPSLPLPPVPELAESGSSTTASEPASPPSGRDTGCTPLAGRQGAPARAAAATLLLVAGLALGAAVEKARVLEPRVVRGQFRLRSWPVLKASLAATGSTSIALVVACIAVLRFQALFDASVVYGGRRARPALALTLAGAVAMGAGAALSGALPGLVLLQALVNVQRAWLTLVALLAGGLLLDIAGAAGRCATTALPTRRTGVPAQMEDLIPGVDKLPLMIISGIAVMLAVLVVEVAVPWTDYGRPCSETLFLRCVAWPPAACGIIIGLAQLLAIPALGTLLAGEGCLRAAFCSVLRRLPPSARARLPGVNRPARPAPAAEAKGVPGAAWQVLVLAAAAGAAVASAALSGTLADESSKAARQGAQAWASVSGGLLLAVGSRLLRGGDLLRGIGAAATLSIDAAFALLVGSLAGVATAFALDAAGAFNIPDA